MRIFILALVMFSTFQCLANVKEQKYLSLAEVKNLLPCAAPLVSHWVHEKGFAKEFITQYGNYEFSRTDVGEPDGQLVVKVNGQVQCTEDLSLNPDIYFMAKTQVMILSAYSGSSFWFEFYRLSGKQCPSLGVTKAGSVVTAATKRLLDESDGNRLCVN